MSQNPIEKSFVMLFKVTNLKWIRLGGVSAGAKFGLWKKSKQKRIVWVEFCQFWCQFWTLKEKCTEAYTLSWVLSVLVPILDFEKETWKGPGKARSLSAGQRAQHHTSNVSFFVFHILFSLELWSRWPAERLLASPGPFHVNQSK